MIPLVFEITIKTIVVLRMIKSRRQTGVSPRANLLSSIAFKVTAVGVEYTLENLLAVYYDYLKSLDRKSPAAARSIFKVHVLQAWPKIAAQPVNVVTDSITIMHGKGRPGKAARPHTVPLTPLAATALQG